MERRNQKRLSCYAKVLMLNINKPGYLRDITEHGCHIDLVETCEIKAGAQVQIIISPMDDLNVFPFKINLLIKWVKEGELYFHLGGEFVSIPESAKKKLDKLLIALSKLDVHEPEELRKKLKED